MKKLILLSILFPFLMIAQTKSAKKAPVKKKVEQQIKEDLTKETTLKDKDFITDTNGIRSNRRTILLNDGSDKPVETQFLFSSPQEKFKDLGNEQINTILHISNYKTLLSTKNKYTYQPRKVSLLYDEDNGQWTCAIGYTAQNDYGALKDGTIFYIYDQKGNFIKSLAD